MHLLALSKYKTRSELFDRLKYEGAPKNEKIEEFLASADAIIKEVGYCGIGIYTLVMLEVSDI